MDPVIPTVAPVVTPVAPVVTPPVVAPVVAPVVVAPAAPVVPVAPAVEPSLIDVAPAAPAAPQTEAEKLAAAQALVEAARLAADPNAPQAWVLSEGVLGKGEKPSWFKGDKYATVAKQAEAYVALEQRFGAFVGAPKDGKYEWKAPENLPGVEIDMANPLMKGFNEWAAKSQLSPQGYNEVLGMLVQYEAQQAPNMASIKAQVGENADQRITAVNQWAKANLEAPIQQALRSSMTGKNAADVFKTMEALIAQTAQARMPKPGDDVPGAGAGGLAKIEAMAAAKNEKGQRLVDVEPGYRKKVFEARAEYAKANPVNRDRNGQIRG